MGQKKSQLGFSCEAGVPSALTATDVAHAQSALYAGVASARDAWGASPYSAGALLPLPISVGLLVGLAVAAATRGARPGGSMMM